MPLPPEYTDAHNALISFRSVILNDLVGSRVKAGLDAGHDGMQKYKSIIDGLSVTPYMYGRVRELALTLKFKNMDVGVGEIRRIGSSWIGATTMYPTQPPYNVPQRSLPQVDQFLYTPITDTDFLEKTDTALLSSFVLAQADSDTFSDSAQAENAIYDYYEFVPQVKATGGRLLVGGLGAWSTYHHIKGERTVMRCRLFEKNTYTEHYYVANIYLDAIMQSDAGDRRVAPIIIELMHSASPPEITWSVCGTRIPFEYDFVWAYGLEPVRDYQNMGRIGGFSRIGESLASDPADPEVQDWRNTFDVDFHVNNPTMGVIDPPDGTTVKAEADSVVTVHAYPNAGYMVDHWVRNGAPIGTGDVVNVNIYRNTAITCYFRVA